MPPPALSITVITPARSIQYRVPSPRLHHLLSICLQNRAYALIRALEHPKRQRSIARKQAAEPIEEGVPEVHGLAEESREDA